MLSCLLLPCGPLFHICHASNLFCISSFVLEGRKERKKVKKRSKEKRKGNGRKGMKGRWKEGKGGGEGG